MERIKKTLEILEIEAEQDVIDFYYNGAKEEILNYLNLEELPKGVEAILSKRVLGMVLEYLYVTNKIESIKIEPKITAITRGDVSMQMSGETPSERFLSYIDNLKNYGDLRKYRRVKWNIL